MSPHLGIIMMLLGIIDDVTAENRHVRHDDIDALNRIRDDVKLKLFSHLAPCDPSAIRGAFEAAQAAMNLLEEYAIRYGLLRLKDENGDDVTPELPQLVGAPIQPDCSSHRRRDDLSVPMNVDELLSQLGIECTDDDPTEPNDDDDGVAA